MAQGPLTNLPLLITNKLEKKISALCKVGLCVCDDDIWFIMSGVFLGGCNPGYHTLYQWYRSVESEHFPDPTGLRARIEQWTFGLYPACIKYLMSAFDVPEV